MAAVIALLVIALLLTNKSEKFVEMFGFSGHSVAKGVRIDRPYKGSGNLRDEAITITRDQMNTVIQAVMKEMETCVYPLETNNIKLIDESVYRANFTFMASDGGFPIGVGIQADVMLKDNVATVVGMSTQPMKTTNNIEAFNPSIGAEFQGFEIISKTNAPTADALSNAKNSFSI